CWPIGRHAAKEHAAKLRDSIYSKRFSFQVYAFQGQSVCKAVCGDCDQSYSCVNMSTTNEHKCKPKRQRADTTPDGPAAAAAAAAELPFQRIAKCWNGTALPTCVVEQFWPMFFVCAEIPFNKVGNKYLEDALTLVGIPMRSDSSLLNGDLDKRYEEVNSLVKLKVDRLDASGVSASGERLYTAARNRLGMERAKRLIFIKANADCYGCNGGADAELLALMGE
ncbi:hypothetical protein QJQ45_029576, partial [Haematococcus lacustris]